MVIVMISNRRYSNYTFIINNIIMIIICYYCWWCWVLVLGVGCWWWLQCHHKHHTQTQKKCFKSKRTIRRVWWRMMESVRVPVVNGNVLNSWSVWYIALAHWVRRCRWCCWCTRPHTHRMSCSIFRLELNQYLRFRCAVDRKRNRTR